ncbi:serine/threonine-protein kinase [Microtetraspora niveoalba]|uniref:serine/threonine-protein kinase n=1 Tax=Microtetraspora niveoalba TaxID=46175 RepID=UPI00082A8B57|nr:serine/threonine-protein kinase [Microtetraspora niveoalba]
MGEIHPLLPDDPEQVGGYALFGRLGEGPRGVAYLGRPSPEAVASVVKLMHPRPSADAEARDRLVQELTEAKGLSGSHAVPPVEAGWLGDRPYVVRGYVKGASLQETVRTDGTLEAEALERLALGTLTALTAIHAAGLAHRGITPDNILIGTDGPRVSDIGMGGSGGAYRAPEQVRGEPGDARSDLFSWAASIAYAATGKTPGAPDAPEAEAASGTSGAVTGSDKSDAEAASAAPDAAASDGPSPESTVNLREVAAAMAETRASETDAQKPTAQDGPSPETTVNIREVTAALAAGGSGTPALDGVPQPLRRILLSCLSPDPAARPTARNAMLRLLGEDDAAATPSTDVAVVGGPMPGAPVAGVVLPAQQPFPGPDGGRLWGAPPMPGGVPSAHGPHQNGPLPGGPHQNGPHGNPMAGPGQVWQGPPAQRPAAPVWGAPPMPNQAPPHSQAGGPTLQDQGAPRRKGPSVGLAASLAAVLALSVGGVWAAGHYADSKSFDRTAAEGTAEGGHAAGAPGEAIPSSGTTAKKQQPQTQVTVPWASTPDPGATGVFPLTLPTDWVDESPTPAVSVDSRVPDIPISPPAVPTWQPTATSAPTADETPTSRPSRTRRPRPSPSPTTEPPSPTEKPTETREPAPDPTTRAPEPSPSPTRRVEPDPTPTRRPDPTPTKRPDPEPTKTVAPTPTKKVEPEPTKTQAPEPKTVAPPPEKQPEARNPYTPQQVCNTGGHGSGFYVQRSASFDGGTVYQLYSNASGYNCVVAMKTANVGKASSIWAKLEVQGGGSSGDSGSFEYYAGPVMLAGKGKCVRYSGGSGSSSGGGDWANCG